MSIVGDIQAAIAALRSHPEMQPTFSARGLAPGTVLVVNNCFIYRDVKTNKAEEYLAFMANARGVYSARAAVITGPTLNSDVKTFHPRETSAFGSQTLGAAVKAQRLALGDLVMCLLGTVDDTVRMSLALQTREFKTLTLDPLSVAAVTVSPPEITIRSASDEGAVWNAVAQYRAAQGDPTDEGRLRGPIAQGLEQLLVHATAKLNIPVRGSAAVNGLIDALVRVLRQHLVDYRVALRSMPAGSASVPHEVLRIAYNFAGDALRFLRLVISICDLKPVVFWMTIDKQFLLYRAFKNLPWMTHLKPSLDSYYSMVSGARNTAFHQFFPFKKTLVTKLPGTTFQDATASLFPEYQDRTTRQLYFRDKELLDVLMEFTRTKERGIDATFWARNADVMEASADLFDAVALSMRHLNG